MKTQTYDPYGLEHMSKRLYGEQIIWREMRYPPPDDLRVLLAADGKVFFGTRGAAADYSGDSYTTDSGLVIVPVCWALAPDCPEWPA